MTSGMAAPAAVRSKEPVTAARDPVLISKITVPRVPGWAVRRPQIDRLLAKGAGGPLTTVTGLPGSGKTMAIASWAAARSDRATVVWVSLDDYDNRPKVFWSYVVAALRRSGIAIPLDSPAAGHRTVDHLFLLRLASVLAAQDPPVVVVLDDLHLVTDQDTLSGLAYLLRNATPGLRLVVSSRMDPLLPLHRYRLTGELTEICADDLAFSVPESALVMARQGITLSSDGLERIVGRTEGWAAGVRLAAISLDGHPDPEQFAKEFGAEDSAVTSYLIDEVLNAQPAAIRDFLLRTSILNQVSAGLARELIDDNQATDVLPALAQANVFVRPVGHGWYRYHSLFAAVLRLKLRRECPGQVLELNRRAALWYQRNGPLSEAVRHAEEAGDWPFAARIAVDALAIDELIEPRGNRSLAERFRRMPVSPAWTHPHPLLVQAALELSDGGHVLGSTPLDAAEGILACLPAAGEIPARLAAAQIRLAVSRRIGHPDAAVAAAARTETLLKKIPGSDRTRHPEIHTQVRFSRGAVEFWSGALDQAAASLGSAIASAPNTGGTYHQGECLGYLAVVEALRGRLSHAADLADRAAGAAENRGHGLAEFTSPAASVALAYVHLERNELRHAHGQLKLADGALRIAPDRLIGAIACMVAARCQLAEGNIAAASDMVSRARHGWSPPRWLEHRLMLIHSRVCATAGDIRSAVDVAERAEPHSAFDAAVALAQAWLAAGDHQAASRALAAAVASRDEPPGQVRLEGWLVDARLSYGSSDRARGCRSLERALQLGKPERLRLAFAMERTWIHPVLRRDPELARAYQDLLELSQMTASRLAGLGPDTAQSAPIIIEPLSDREREVLRLVSAMLSTAEISTEMYISVNTVKSHLRSIYRKLSAARRGEAVRRARELKLI
jgi:LuxR family maltose regulon positive regulatory protein